MYWRMGTAEMAFFALGYVVKAEVKIQAVGVIQELLHEQWFRI